MHLLATCLLTSIENPLIAWVNNQTFRIKIQECSNVEISHSFIVAWE